MVELRETVDYVWLFVLAGGLGAVGGLAFELMQTRLGETGMLEIPSRRGTYRDVGFWASILIGAIAAVASLWVFPPEVNTTVTEGGRSTTTTEYDLIKVVGLSLIVGSAGSSFLSALQARALAKVKAQEAEITRRVANEQISLLEEHVEAGTPSEQLGTQLEAARSAVEATRTSGPGNPTFG